MQTLPITKIIPEIKEKLLAHQRVVLQAPAGAGKTTALPLALLNEPWIRGKKIIMLEPRRLAVRASATRMAELLGEKVGERIGYQIKMDSVWSKKTEILIVTEGILTRKLQRDPSLEDVAQTKKPKYKLKYRLTNSHFLRYNTPKKSEDKKWEEDLD